MKSLRAQKLSSSTINQKLSAIRKLATEAEDSVLPQIETNKLLLPASLQNKVFFILTTLEQTNYRLTVDREESLYLKDDDPQNLADVKEGVIHRKNYIMSIIGREKTVIILIKILSKG